MRIIAGKMRGLRLTPVGQGDRDAHLRPTSDRVRENIFNLLMGGSYGDPITGAAVLDLFAGTGALGLEALSRGAAHVTFIDDGEKSRSLITRNISLCNATGQARLQRGNATRLASSSRQFDLVFLDPPYGLGLAEQALSSARAGGWISRSALVVCEEAGVVVPPPGFSHLDTRKYGSTRITILRAAEQS